MTRDEVFTATYAAYFAAECMEHRKRTGESPNDNTLDGIAEEAAAIGVLAARRAHAAKEDAEKYL